MLARRYRQDGKPLLRLNPLQCAMRDRVTAKVRAGDYRCEQVPCAVCDADEPEVLAEKDRYGLDFSVVICRRCGLVYTNPRMDQASYAAFYDAEYRPLYHGREQPVADLFRRGFDRAPCLVDFLRRHGRAAEGLRVLEVGCGAGGILAHLRDRHGCVVKGCDLGREGIRYGVERHGLDLEVGTLRAVGRAWRADLLVYSHVFEHLLDLGAECALMRAVLGATGVCYVEVPGIRNIRRAYGGDFLELLQNAHTYHFTRATLSNVMGRHGLRIAAGDEFVRALFVPGAPSTAFTNDYPAVMRFLRRTERARAIRRFVGRAARVVYRGWRGR